MGALQWLVDLFAAYIPIGDQKLLVREVVGNAFGLASAIGGMRRAIWAWPVGIVGNVLLLTVFLGTLLDPSSPVPHLLGQAGRQAMFIAVAIYGWVRWRGASSDDGRIAPRWASWPTRITLIIVMVGGTLVLTPLFRALDSYEPVWADAWTFMGSLLATWGMAKRWTEFWLIWVAVDIVGVPLLFSAGFYASGLMYAFYGCFTIAGFIVWWRGSRRAQAPSRIAEP